MPENNPFDQLFDQINELLKFVQERAHIPPNELNIPPDIDKRLEKITKRIEEFKRVSEDIVNLSEVSKEELNMRLNGLSKKVPTEGKQLIDKGNIIRSEVEKLNDRFEALLKSASVDPGVVPPPPPADRPKRQLSEKEESKKRRSKFKRFGGDDKWKPL